MQGSSDGKFANLLKFRRRGISDTRFDIGEADLNAGYED